MVRRPGPEAGRGVENIFFYGWGSTARGWQRRVQGPRLAEACPGPFEVWLGVQGPRLAWLGVQGPRLLALLPNTLWITAADALLRLMVGSPGLEAGRGVEIHFIVGCQGPSEVWLDVQGPRLLLALLPNTLRITAADAFLWLMVGSPGPEAGIVGCPGPKAAASTAFQHTPDYRSRRVPPAYGWESRAQGWQRRRNPWDRPQTARRFAPAPLPPRTAIREALQRPGPSLSTAYKEVT
jgi:hypothetical protein